MNLYKTPLFSTLLLVALSCEKNDDLNPDAPSGAEHLKSSNFEAYFEHAATLQVGGEGASEISAYDAKTKKLFTVNVEVDEISVHTIADIHSPVREAAISVGSGSPNSVAVHKGKVAVAVESQNKQAPGSVQVYDAVSQSLLQTYTVGSLPDMVTFSPNGRFIVTANEGEPDDDYLVDPNGSVSIIDIHTHQVTTLTFEAFNGQQAALEAGGFRVFGPNATLARDVEPEYVAISDNSTTAWVTLQENNGIARVNLITKQIEGIFPMGFKDHNLFENALDASNQDGVKELKNWPVYGIYQPDAISYMRYNGMDILITANEGDARDYDGFSEEVRVRDLVLDPVAFPESFDYQDNANLGRLKTTTTMGDIDGDGDYDEIYSYGARSFSVWSGNGTLLYDSGNEIANRTLQLTPDRFNDDDKRSDDKGAEPEAVEILKLGGTNHVLFVGLERTDQVLVYDISNPYSPEFIQILSHSGDEAPEGLLAIPAKDSPTGKDLLVISNEDSGTVSFYENIR